MGAGPVLGQRLLAVAGKNFDVDSGALGRLLERFSDALHGLHGAHVYRDLEAVGHACLRQQRLGLVDVELVGVLGTGAQQADVDLQRAEPCVVGGEQDVAAGSKGQAGADSRAVDRPDGGHRAGRDPRTRLGGDRPPLG